MRLFIILFLFLLLILFMPVKFKTKMVYNVLKNKGFLSLYFYNIKLIVTTWRFVPFKILIKNKNKKDIKILLYDLNNETYFKDIFFKKLLKKIKINNFRTIGRFGFNKNCLVTSIGSGSILILSQLFNCYLTTNKSCDNVSSYIFTDFTKNNFIMCITASIRFNLFLISITALTALFKKANKERVYGK